MGKNEQGEQSQTEHQHNFRNYHRRDSLLESALICFEPFREARKLKAEDTLGFCAVHRSIRRSRRAFVILVRASDDLRLEFGVFRREQLAGLVARKLLRSAYMEGAELVLRYQFPDRSRDNRRCSGTTKFVH